MIRATKLAVKGLDLPKYMTEIELETFLAEAQSVINNRPLFFDGEEIVTPNHFIRRCKIAVMVQPDTHVDDTIRAQAHAQIRNCLCLLAKMGCRILGPRPGSTTRHDQRCHLHRRLRHLQGSEG